MQNQVVGLSVGRGVRRFVAVLIPSRQVSQGCRRLQPFHSGKTGVYAAQVSPKASRATGHQSSSLMPSIAPSSRRRTPRGIFDRPALRSASRAVTYLGQR